MTTNPLLISPDPRRRTSPPTAGDLTPRRAKACRAVGYALSIVILAVGVPAVTAAAAGAETIVADAQVPKKPGVVVPGTPGVGVPPRPLQVPTVDIRDLQRSAFVGTTLFFTVRLVNPRPEAAIVSIEFDRATRAAGLALTLPVTPTCAPSGSKAAPLCGVTVPRFGTLDIPARFVAKEVQPVTVTARSFYGTSTATVQVFVR